MAHLLASRRSGDQFDPPHSFSLMELIGREDWEWVRVMAEGNPQSVCLPQLQTGFFENEHDSCVLPLHLACSLQPPLSIVQLLLELYPKGAKCRDSKFHRLPLHIACQTNAALDVIELLVDHYPAAAESADSLGRLPLHYACSHQANVLVIDTLLKAYPESVRAGDFNGWLPLHVACRFAEDEDVICRLVQAEPDSLYWTTRRGSTPLMCAKRVRDRHNVLHLVEMLESLTGMDLEDDQDDDGETYMAFDDGRATVIEFGDKLQQQQQPRRRRYRSRRTLCCFGGGDPYS